MTDFKNVMIDIETFGTRTNSIIVSISAVKFAFGSDDTEVFHVNIDPISSKSYGMVTDKATVDWWKEQSPDVIRSLSMNRKPLDVALDELSTFIGKEFEQYKDMTIWANGAAFDFPIIEWSYHAVGKTPPWRYWNLRDARTIYKVFSLDFKTYQRVGQHHNSLDDCLTQIKALKECLL